MKRTKYIAEFKSEAVRQIADKGHSAVEVSSLLGVPVGILYSLARKLKEPDLKPMEDVKAPASSDGQTQSGAQVIHRRA
jgi:transposase-like protein